MLTPGQALDFITAHGVVCEAARRSDIPSLVDAIAGETVRGNWWAHMHGKRIFAITRAVRESPQILVCRLIDAKITFVHERLWPALARVAARFPPEYVARLRETHSASGKHVVTKIPFPDWVPEETSAAAARLDEDDASARLAMLSPFAEK